MILKCINCFVEFEKPQEQKTCSRKCSDELKKRNSRELRNCIMCKNEFEVKKTNHKKMCSDECRKKWDKIPENRVNRIKNAEQAVLEKYGVKSTLLLDFVKEKIQDTKLKLYNNAYYVNIEKQKQTCLEKYGSGSTIGYSEVITKRNNSKKEKYGDENYNNRGKAKETTQKLYGVDYAIQKEEFQDKRKNTNLQIYGVEHALQNEEIKLKLQETNLKKYGVKYASQNDDIKEKVKNTNILTYGVSSLLLLKEVRDKGKMVIFNKYGTFHPMKLPEIKEKRVQSNLLKYGVQHPMQTQDVIRKNHLSGLRIKYYKETNITYQGSYELYFLEQMQNCNLLSEVENGKSYTYSFNDEEHVYHTDFFFRGQNIEIKSNWTYNKCGSDQELQNLNESKWKAVRDSGDRIMVLMEKGEINGFIKSLS